MLITPDLVCIEGLLQDLSSFLQRLHRGFDVTKHGVFEVLGPWGQTDWMESLK